MKKSAKNLPYYYLFLIIPLFIIPFIQTKALLDISLNIRFIALNICLLFGAVFFTFTKKPLKISLNPFLILYSIYVLYSIISVIISANRPDAIFQFLIITDLGILTFLFFLIFSAYPIKTKYISLIFNLLGLTIITIAFLDYFKVLSTVGISHQSIYNISATFSHKNIISEVLFVTLPFSMYSLFSKSNWIKTLGGINCVGILFLIITLITRAVWLSISIGFILTFFCFITISGKEKLRSLFQNKKTYFFILLFFIISISSFAIYSRTDSFETIVKSTQKIFKPYDSSQHRIELWKRTIDIAKENPILGKGLATWRIEVLKYGTRGLQSQDNITFYQRPHNDFLWVLSEQGIVGLVLFVSLFVIILYNLTAIIKQTKSNDELFFLYASLYLLIGYLIFSFFSFPRERIEHQLFIGVIFGFILAKHNSSFNDGKRNYFKLWHGRFGFILIDVLLIFSTYFAFSRFNSEVHLKKAFEARSLNDWNRVIPEINKAESLFYKIDPFSTPILWYRGEAYFVLGDMNSAFKDYQQCYETNPYHFHVLNNLATCYELKGEHLKAIELYNKAIHIAPKFEDALLNLTAVYYNTGKYDSAYSILNRVDSTSKNGKYIPYLEVVLKKRIEILSTSIKEERLTMLFKNIQENNQWIVNIFIKSKQNSCTFDKQLILDCLYLLKDVDKSIDSKQYNELENKFITKNKHL